MRSIARLFGAIGTLADSVLALSGVIDSATSRLQQQLGSDGEAATILEHNAIGVEGEHVGTNGTAKGRKSRAGV